MLCDETFAMLEGLLLVEMLGYLIFGCSFELYMRLIQTLNNKLEGNL